MANLRDIIKQLIKDNEEIYSVICSVKSVDKVKRTCNVTPINGDADLFSVRLQSKVSSEIGLVLFPSVDSHVTVTFISKELAFVSKTNQIDEILLNIGEFSLFIDEENFNKSVKNSVLNIESLTQNSTNTEINSNVYVFNGENIKFTLSDIFEIESQKDIKLQAVDFILNATNANITATNVNITGATNINGAATISGAATMQGAVSMGGGANGGIPKSSAISQELNKLVSEVNKIITAFSGWSPVNNDGGAALKARVSGLQTLSPIDSNNISNSNALH